MWKSVENPPADEYEKVVVWQPPTGLDKFGMWFMFARHIHNVGWVRRGGEVLDYVTWWMDIPPVPEKEA